MQRSYFLHLHKCIKHDHMIQYLNKQTEEIG
jgi:hypothetical protein